MAWIYHVRRLFLITLVFQVIHLGNGFNEKEKLKGSAEEPINTTAPKQQPPNQNPTWNSTRDLNRSSESPKQFQSRPFIPFIGFKDGTKLCCQNGGTCVLGSFCVCPMHFVGRHCEHDERKSNCGVFAHGDWVYKGCYLCRCIYGKLHCFRDPTLNNCDEETVTQRG
ncbi:cryptic protein isoform X2 [Monodelphis domestica]|uniref:cryptic protein isoform X2 n=1 Tax=Monodelphis domestica TaxID=13616 RepID=UPI0004433771|nr:cryptic protein isoform X2 [Monodelphis domestica]